MKILNYNELPFGKRADEIYIYWSKIDVGFIFKTNHDCYGYNEFSLVEYIPKGNFLILNYNGKTHKTKTSNFIRGQIGDILGNRTSDFRYNVGDLIDNILITNRKYIKSGINGRERKYYEYTCKKCGWTEGSIEESNLTNGKGCSCCAGQTTVLGINTIYDTDRWMIDLGVLEEESKKYTKGSNKKINVICPYCGNKKQVAPSNIYKNKSISCTYCGDGVSRPEKFMVCIFKSIKYRIQNTTK